MFIISYIIDLANSGIKFIGDNFSNLIITIFFIFSLFRVLRMILTESVDLEVNDEEIILHNRVTGKSKSIKKKNISGYRIERYKWNFVKISGVKSFWEFESKMVVIYSNYRAIIHLKSTNYVSIKKISRRLLCNGYYPVPKYKKFFDKYNYLYL